MMRVLEVLRGMSGIYNNRSVRGIITTWNGAHSHQTLRKQFMQICGDHNVVVKIDKLYHISKDVSEVEACKYDVFLEACSTQLYEPRWAHPWLRFEPHLRKAQRERFVPVLQG